MPKRATILALMLLVVVACGRRTEGARLRQYIAAAATAKSHVRVDTSNVWIEPQRSAVDGLQYLIGHWSVWTGEVPPPTGAVVAGSLNGKLATLSSVAEWNRLVAGTDTLRWAQATPALCAEVVELVGPRARFDKARPLMYEGPRTLQQTQVRLLNPARIDTTRLSAPAQAPGSNGRAFDLWFLEAGRAARYRCTIGPRGVGLAVLDSIRGVGLNPWPDKL